ncbi:hypothetical protein Tco_0284946 [Tanacetum coccineum]
MEDAELKNENRTQSPTRKPPMPQGISRNYFKAPRKVPDDYRPMTARVGAFTFPFSPLSSGIKGGQRSWTLVETQEGSPVERARARQEGASCQSSGSTSTREETPVCAPPTLAARSDRDSSPNDQLMEEFDMVTAQQAALGRILKQDAQAEAESSRSYAQKLAEEKMALLVKVEQERANSADYKASCHWAVKYLEGVRTTILLGWKSFARIVCEELLEKQEEKLRKLSIEYDEELYPHMLSAIAERRWLISHGLRLAAMSTLESQEVKQSFGDVVKCALARGKAEAVEELHEKKLLTVPAAQLSVTRDYPIDVIMAGLTLARHATEGAEAQPDYFLKPDVAQLQVPIFARPRDILNPFALEKEIPLRESLESHAKRLAKKKEVKGKAILCGVGAAHIPRSDGVLVSVATVSPKDSELLEKLEETKDAAY